MQDVLVEARAADDLASACVALQGLGMVAMAAGHVADSQDYLTEAMTLFDAGQIPAATFVYSLPHTLQAFNLLGLDDIDGAISAANRAPDPVGSHRSRVSGALGPRRHPPLPVQPGPVGRRRRRRRGDPVTPRDERSRRCVDRRTGPPGSHTPVMAERFLAARSRRSSTVSERSGWTPTICPVNASAPPAMTKQRFRSSDASSRPDRSP